MYTHRYRAISLALAALAFAGCENKNKPTETATPPSGSAAKPAGDDMKPEPVGKDPGGAALPAQPSPDPTPGADVRPPTAADLAE